jgi:hypothetical protein
MNVVVIGMDTQLGLRSVTDRRSAHELGPCASEKRVTIVAVPFPFSYWFYSLCPLKPPMQAGQDSIFPNPMAATP